MSTGIADRYVVSAVSCGRDHTLALLASGKVIGWGGDGSGRVPSGGPEYCTSPAPTRAVELLSHDALAKVAAGDGMSLAVTHDRTVTAWGITPSRVAGLSRIRVVAAGEFQHAAIDDAGELFTWGMNVDGALGRRCDAFQALPARVSIPAAQAIAVGKGYMLALTKDGEAYAWGANGAGQLGLGHLSSVAIPERVRTGERIDAVEAGASHALAVTARGKVLAWGSNNHGQLGREAPAYSTTPVAVELPEQVTAVAAGMYFSVALARSGRVYAWGWNGQGQLAAEGSIDRDRPQRVAALADVRAIAAGQAHVVALAPDGLYGWGSNAAGQLGDARRVQDAPVKMLLAKEFHHA